MELIKGEWTLIDANNRVVVKSYIKGNEVIAKIVMDLSKGTTSVEGNLYNLLGYTDTETDKGKYSKLLETEKWMANEILTAMRKNK